MHIFYQLNIPIIEYSVEDILPYTQQLSIPFIKDQKKLSSMKYPQI